MQSLQASACAMIFIGNTPKQIQQDALYFNGKCSQSHNGLGSVKVFNNEFCVAVADGISDYNFSQYASKILVKSVHKNWHNYLHDNGSQSHVMTINNIQAGMVTKNYYDCFPKSTLAMLYAPKGKQNKEVVIKHVGDSRVYVLRAGSDTWQCLTRDHNVLNQMVDDKAKQENRQVAFHEYNKTNMARMYYMVTESFVLQQSMYDVETPNHDNLITSVNIDDSFMVCTDGVYDCVPSEEWGLVNGTTDLKSYLHNLKRQIYSSEKNANDNATAILIRFDDC